MMSSSSESSRSKVHTDDKVGRSQENDEALDVACFENNYNNYNLPFELGRERSLGECELSGDNPKEGKVTADKHAKILMEEVSNVMVQKGGCSWADLFSKKSGLVDGLNIVSGVEVNVGPLVEPAINNMGADSSNKLDQFVQDNLGCRPISINQINKIYL
ncbi:hypothetical protein V6N13_017302 [Hibiscus sabdariffa]